MCMLCLLTAHLGVKESRMSDNLAGMSESAVAKS